MTLTDGKKAGRASVVPIHPCLLLPLPLVQSSAFIAHSAGRYQINAITRHHRSRPPARSRDASAIRAVSDQQGSQVFAADPAPTDLEQDASHGLPANKRNGGTSRTKRVERSRTAYAGYMRRFGEPGVAGLSSQAASRCQKLSKTGVENGPEGNRLTEMKHFSHPLARCREQRRSLRCERAPYVPLARPKSLGQYRWKGQKSLGQLWGGSRLLESRSVDLDGVPTASSGL